MDTCIAETTSPVVDNESCAIALIDLPINSLVGVDGQSIRLQREDFVGIKGVPTKGFHLVIARAGACGTSEEQKQGNVAATSAGFVLQTTPGGRENQVLALVRRYDPMTEEVSSKLEDSTTISNLSEQIKAGQIGPQRMVSYSDFVSTDQFQAWSKLTDCISETLLVERKIQNGSKIVPGSYGGEESKISTNTTSATIVDGASVTYPVIPVMNNESTSSVRYSRHEGTKRFLSALSPTDRTSLFHHENPSTVVMEMVLKQHYGGDWQHLIGDLQLSYVLFLHLQCLSSLEHWRDLLAMLSNVDAECVELNLELFCNLLETLGRQVTTIEADFFEDIEISGDNFLVPALKQLCRTTAQIDDDDVHDARTRLCRVLENRFRDIFHNVSATPRGPDPGSRMDVDGEEEDDEVGPVVVSNEEVEAAIARSSQSSRKPGLVTEQYPPSVRKKYPVLFAAKLEHEDILMTCARALDDATDVSLVREAGSFLVEEVEPDTT